MEKQAENTKHLVVGIDLHPDSFAAAAFDADSSADGCHRWIHGKVSTCDWRNWLRHNVPPRSTVVLEAGGNSFFIAEEAEELGYKAVILDSGKAGRIAKSYCKNDKNDAVKLARIYLCGLLDEHVWKPDHVTRMRRELFSCYDRAQKDSTRAKNRLRSFFTGQGIRLKTGTRLTRESTEKVLLREHRWTKSQELVLRTMFSDIRYSEKKRWELHAEISRQVLEQPMMRELMRLCGIRVLCAYAIMAAVGDIGRFRNPKKLVAYLGLAPRVRESGNSRTGRGIAKCGRKEVKRLLIQAAQAVLRSKNNSGEKLRKWGWHLMFRKNKKTAIAAVARKLAVAVWYLMNGIMPETVDISNDVKKKIKKIAEELTLNGIRQLGYDTVNEFIREYSECILLKT